MGQHVKVGQIIHPHIIRAAVYGTFASLERSLSTVSEIGALKCGLAEMIKFLAYRVSSNSVALCKRQEIL